MKFDCRTTSIVPLPSRAIATKDDGHAIMYFIKFVLVTLCISEEQKGNCQAGCYGLEVIQALSLSLSLSLSLRLCTHALVHVYLTDMSSCRICFVHLHAMLVADKVRKLWWFKVLDSYAGLIVLPNLQ